MYTMSAVKKEGSKMSVCNAYVEHVWKPGSCKNCFNPRSSHKLKALLDFDSNHQLLQNRNGIKYRTDKSQSDGDYVNSLFYSKPTIAVKPTLMNSDLSEMWTNVNMNIDTEQVNHKVQHEEHHVKMPMDLQSFLIENSNNRMKESAGQNPFSNNISRYYRSYSSKGSSNHEATTEGQNSFHSTDAFSENEGQETRVLAACRDKLTNNHCSNYSQQHASCTNQNTYCNKDSVNCSITPESSSISLENSDSYSEILSCYSPGFRGDNGDAYSTIQYAEGQVLNGPLKSQEALTWHGIVNTNQKYLVQDSPMNFLLNPGRECNSGKREIDFNERSRFLNCESSHQGELCVQKNHACPDRKALAVVFESTSISDSCPWNQTGSFTSSQETGLKHSEPCRAQKYMEHDNRPPYLSALYPKDYLKESRPKEPIYAESTKRKKKFLNDIKNCSKNQMSAFSFFCEEQDNSHNEKEDKSNVEKQVQDPSTQVAAKITVMAAHAEDDNRIICLNSPDSAVGVQWPCFSPITNEELGNITSSFQWTESSHANKEATSSEKNEMFTTKVTSKYPSSEGPAIPPKQFRATQSVEQGTPTAQNAVVLSPLPCYNNIRCDITDCQYTSGSCKNIGFLECSNHVSRSLSVPFTCSRVTAEETVVCPSLSAAERRHKFHNTVWHRQCKIKEEEEENEEIASWSQASGSENGPVITYSSANHKYSASPHLNDRNNLNEEGNLVPPPPPPKKHSRNLLKMNQNTSKLEFSQDSIEHLKPSLKGINTSSSAVSSDSLSSENRILSDGVSDQTQLGRSLQPPPLPRKKMMNRTVSAPDGSLWGQLSPSRRVKHPTSPQLNFSNSESSVCGYDEHQFGFPSSPANRHYGFSSSDFPEKCLYKNGLKSKSADESSNRTGSSLRNKSTAAFSASQLSVNSQVSSSSNLHLHTLLSNIDSKDGMFSKLSSLYAESLRRLAIKCKDYFTQDQKATLRFDESNWSLFKLKSNNPCCDAGDAVYYSASCAKDPQHSYSVKISKNHNRESKQSHFYSLSVQQSLPAHFNVQQECGYFIASVPLSMLPPAEASKDTSAAKDNHSLCFTSEQECVVVLTHEVPYQTAADLVRNWISTHKSQPEVYERHICLLLLQLCSGLEHLKEQGVIHSDLCLENLLLAPCRSPIAKNKNKDENHLPRLLISNFSKAKQTSCNKDPKLQKDQARLAPEIVTATQYKKVDEFQMGILIYELLHQSNPFEVMPSLKEHEYNQSDLPPIENMSIYSKGLQLLAHLLLEPDPMKRIHITEAKQMLQSLLWGPRKELFEQQLRHMDVVYDILQNWISMKQALLMMKFAERSLDSEQNLELEDWLCCQYFAGATSTSLCHTVELLQLF
nr:PREDICTED: tyrosine-protein kinase SgK223 [Latimeria chalumnae]|eukprot:XP_014354506.1 PREDICTED: tyrosine-protein kinase SgK223 [Latimeria chalumnae]